MKVFTTEKRKKLQELYEAYRDYVYWTGFYIVHDEYDAEDIVQSTFLKISRVLDTIDPAQEEKTKIFLNAVTRNTAIDYYRKKQKRNEELNEADKIYEATDKKLVEDIVVDNDTYKRLHQKIDGLPKKYADMLVLYYFFDLQIKEIAILLSLSEANAYTRMCRAKSLLLEAMGDTEE